jgi:hypothetical protein
MTPKSLNMAYGAYAAYHMFAIGLNLNPYLA